VGIHNFKQHNIVTKQKIIALSSCESSTYNWNIIFYPDNFYSG